MIPLQHPSEPEAYVNSLVTAKFRAMVAEKAEMPYAQQRPYRPTNRIGDLPGVTRVLFDGFGEKCPFCESKLPLVPEGQLPILQFRPGLNASQTRGEVVQNNDYWWLFWEWRNQFPICTPCLYRRGTLFPILNTRARLNKRPKAALTKEGALLLDPCVDYPHDHLRFSEDGGIAGITARGECTIEAFDLARIELREQRALEAGVFRAQWEEIAHALLDTRDADAQQMLVNRLAKLCDDRAVFAGMKRQLMRDWAEGAIGPMPTSPVEAPTASGKPPISSPLNARRLVNHTIVINVFRQKGDVVMGDKVISTDGGAYISGNLSVGGDFVARDAIVNHVIGKLSRR